MKQINETPEERFVRAFVKKGYRERLLHELTSPKKRTRGLSRFCHQMGELLDPARIALQGGDLERQPSFRTFLAARRESCVLLSPDGAFDGLTLPAEKAADAAFFAPDAVIVLGGDFAVVCGEPMKGGREKALLTAPAPHSSKGDASDDK